MSGPAWASMVNDRRKKQRNINEEVERNAYDKVLNPKRFEKRMNKIIGDGEIEPVDIDKISREKMMNSNLLSDQKKKIFPRKYLHQLDYQRNGGRRRKKTRRKRGKSKRRKRRKSKRKRRTKKKRKRRLRKTRK